MWRWMLDTEDFEATCPHEFGLALTFEDAEDFGEGLVRKSSEIKFLRVGSQEGESLHDVDVRSAAGPAQDVGGDIWEWRGEEERVLGGV